MQMFLLMHHLFVFVLQQVMPLLELFRLQEQVFFLELDLMDQFLEDLIVFEVF